MIRLLAISKATLANAVAASLFATAVAAQDVTTDIGTLDKEAAEKVFPAKPPYSPYAVRNFPTRPYFGDTHTHTSYSMDAGAFGARLGPKDAYRFAKGEEVIASSGQRAKLSRPLDFLVVTDHSDGMGFFPQLMGGDPPCWRRHRDGNGTTRSIPAKARKPPSTSSPASARASCQKAFRLRARPPIAAPGARRSRRRKRRTSRAVSPPSSAMSGLQTPAETIFIATSSGATTGRRRASSSHSRPCRRSAVPIPAICGSGWP